LKAQRWDRRLKYY